jgi:hypothetical protein
MDDGVGARLREARVERGVDLAEIEATTKIRTRFLAAIENEEWDLLPSEFHARSFVRTYAAELGLDDLRLEEPRGARAFGTAADRSPRVDPAPPELAHSVRRRRLSPRLLAAIASIGLVAVLVAVALSSLGDGSSGSPANRHRSDGDGRQVAPAPSAQSPGRGTGATLTLTATDEVWVCLLDERGRALIDGQILGPGSEAGPYRSGSFTVSLGNGAVRIALNGRTESIPPTPNPIGFSIDSGGALLRLSEGERPTCT